MNLLRPGSPYHPFPPAEQATPEGLLAVGGDLSVDRLLDAYRQGIFPWYNPGQPILWWSPDPRAVLYPQELRQSRSLRRILKQRRFEVRMDSAFRDVMLACAAPRANSSGTWINDAMVQAYCALHHVGLAHSVEAWSEGRLVGGLYGVAIGGVFFGESMFSRMPDASKVALVTLVETITKWGFDLIDCQVSSAHLTSLGARDIPRSRFLCELAAALDRPGRTGSWAAALHFSGNRQESA